MKQNLVAAGLVIVIIAALIFAVNHVIKSKSGTTLPSNIAEQKVELIDKNSFDVVMVTQGELQTAERQDGCVKNPKTGSFTLTFPIVCESCGAKIPGPPAPKIGPNAPEEKRDVAWMKTQLCPKCNKCAYAKRVEMLK